MKIKFIDMLVGLTAGVLVSIVMLFLDKAIDSQLAREKPYAVSQCVFVGKDIVCTSPE